MIDGITLSETIECGRDAGNKNKLRLATSASPVCDYAEAGIWEAIGGKWQCLYGCFCRCGVSIEWHNFYCEDTVEWWRSFHPDSLEICINLSGEGTISNVKKSLKITPETVVMYYVKNGGLKALRTEYQEHRFLTIECSRCFIEKHFNSKETFLHPIIRGFINKESDCDISTSVKPTTGILEKARLLLNPPIPLPARNIWYNAQALIIMAELFFVNSENIHNIPGTYLRRKTVAKDRVEQVIEILKNNLVEPPGLNQLAKMVGCSEYHLSRTFSREMGMTIRDYLRRLRIEKAAELLKTGKYNVTEAAVEVGYSSISHFSKAFCEIMGCCPALYPYGAKTRMPCALDPDECSNSENNTNTVQP